MRALILCSAICAVHAIAPAQDLFKITPAQPKVGENHAWLFDVNFQAMGTDAKFSGTLKRSVKKVDDNGDVTWESEMADAKVSFGGQSMDQPSEPSTTVVDKNGHPKSERKGDNDMEELLSAFAAVKPPTEGVEKDKVFKLEADGYFKGKSECKVVGTENYAQHDCLKLDVKYTVASGEGSGSGTVYLDSKTGLLVGYTVKFEKVSVAQGIVTDGEATAKLVEGATSH